MRNKFVALAFVVAALSVAGCGGCGKPTGIPQAQSTAGVEVASVGKVETNASGHTVEQQNIIERVKRDNELGATRHLYIISPYSGQVILYSAVKGKPTSGGKRLTPRTIVSRDSTLNGNNPNSGLPVVKVGGTYYGTNDLPNEDGTYGSSSEYLYWFTPDGAYHQHMLTGADIVHISDRPLVVKDVVIRVESGPAK